MKREQGILLIIFLACACMLIGHRGTFSSIATAGATKVENQHDAKLQDLAMAASRLEKMVKSLKQDSIEIKEYILELREDEDSRREEEDESNSLDNSEEKESQDPSQHNDEEINNPQTPRRTIPKKFKINEVMRSQGIVIEEYKLMFMPVAKVGSSLIKRLMMRMNHNPNWCKRGDSFKVMSGIHNPNVTRFVNLGGLRTDKKEEIMTSKDWTRAIFLREPKERILSAFQDKALAKNGIYVKSECCRLTPNRTACNENIQDFAYFLNTSQTYCDHDLHWLPLRKYIDEQWWPWIDFVGYSDTLTEDFEKLLKSLHSTKDGIDAWERFGKTGWDISNGCNETSNIAFGQQVHHTKSNGISTNSVEKLKKYYTPELEQAVETLYRKDWESPYYHFPPIKIF